MNQIDYIKKNKRRKLDLGDYFHLLIVFFSTIPMIGSFFYLSYTINENGKADWTSFIFIFGLGLGLFFMILNTYRNSVHYREILNDRTKEENLAFVQGVIEKNIHIRNLEKSEDGLKVDTKSNLISFGDRITVIVDTNRILYNCWTKWGIWSIGTTRIYDTLDKELKSN